MVGYVSVCVLALAMNGCIIDEQEPGPNGI